MNIPTAHWSASGDSRCNCRRPT